MSKQLDFIKCQSESDSNLDSIDWNFDNSNNRDSIHSIHPYPAKFIPEIPRNLLKVLNPSEHSIVFDPFCGSGATLVEAQKLGYSSLGTDLNPIATLISTVKTSPLPKESIIKLEKICSIASKFFECKIPVIPNLDHWFSTDVQIGILGLKKAINEISEDKLESNLFKVILSSIIVTVSRQDSDTRYTAVDNDYDRNDVIEKFYQAGKKTISYLKKRNYKLVTCKVDTTDIFQFNYSILTNKVGLVVTSPPYPNAYEYWLYHKYRMYWLDFDPKIVKDKEIGARAHYYKKNPPTKDDFLSQLTSLFMMFKHILIENGFVALVIGRSKIHGEIIDNSELVIQGAKRNSFELHESIERGIKGSRKSFNPDYSKINKEHILIFKKN